MPKRITLKRILQKKTKDLGLFTLSFLFAITSLAQTIDATLLEQGFKPDGYPENLVEGENGFYFSGKGYELWFSDGTKDGTYLIKDFGFRGTDDIQTITPIGDLVFFSIKTNFEDYELWVSDGTEEGTIQLTERNASFGNERINEIIEFNGKAYFGAYDNTYGNELWVSDGTIEGTHVLKDINEGELNGSPTNLFVYNNSIFFIANNETIGTEIWVSDGTAEGTLLFKDINPNSSGVLNIENAFFEFDGNLYFFANDGSSGTELWRSDGTEEGTNLFKDINPGGGNSGQFFGGIFQDKMFFIANDGIHGNEFWETDGTEEGTKLFADLYEGPISAIAYNSKFVFGNNKFFFEARGTNTDNGLWVSDGNLEGTIFLKETNSLEADFLVFDSSGEAVVFYAFNDEISKEVLWTSDGTISGTKILSNEVTDRNTSAHTDTFLNYNGLIFFSGENETNGIELWVTDGSNQGTNLFYDLDTSGGTNPTNIKQAGNKMFYACGNKLCSYDISSGEFETLDVLVQGAGTADNPDFITFNDKLIFLGSSPEFGYELWISDGTKEGTNQIKDINPGNASGVANNSNNAQLTLIDDKVYFVGNNGVNGRELWVTDGTEQGTLMIKDINLGSGGMLPRFAGSEPRHFEKFNDEIFFAASDASGPGLFKTNGTESGTVKVTPISRVGEVHAINEKLVVFGENDDGISTPSDLYVSDGTETGTNFIFGFGDACCDGGIKASTVLNDELFMIVTSPVSFRKSIYKTNGTTEGTFPLFDGANHPTPSVDIDEIITCGDYVYFGVKLSQSFTAPSHEVWRTDGTVEGTVLVASSDDGFDSFYEFSCLNDNMYFLDFNNRNNIWATNGDSELKLTFNIVNEEQFDSEATIQEIGVGDNKLWFKGNTELKGQELYMTLPSSIGVTEDLTDSDGDGTVDFFDECPDTDNGLEVNEVGCAENQLDDDNDGVTNDLDLCPETEEGLAVDENGCAENQSPDDDYDGVLNIDDLCPNTPLGESVNEQGCSQSQLDDDQDGVFNNVDICPRTELGVDIDENGCPLEFSLPSDNFQVKIIGETCIDKNNGILSIIASNNEHTYSLNLEGSTYEFTEQLEIPNLEAKIYEFCIIISEEPDYEQCYVIDVPKAENITGKSTTLKTGKSFVETITINSGTAPFTAFINGNQVLSTTSSKFNLEVMSGDEILIKSKFECEGSFNKSIELGSVSFVYPNPTIDLINILIGKSSEEKLSVFIYDSNQRLLSNKEYLVNNGMLELPLKTYPSGIYFILVKIGEEFKTFKIVKS